MDTIRRADYFSMDVANKTGEGARLLAELHATAEESGIRWLEGRCVSYGETLPYWPFRDLLRTEWIGAGADEAELRVRVGLRRRLEQLFADLPWVQECHHVAGEETLLLKVRAESMPALEHLVWDIRALDSVERTRTVVVLATVFEDRPVAAARAGVEE